MPHICTFTPKDPTIVLAQPITEENYDTVYHHMPAKRHLPLKSVLGNFIVIPVDSEAEWGHMSKTLFNQSYEPVQAVYSGEFNIYKAVTKK